LVTGFWTTVDISPPVPAYRREVAIKMTALRSAPVTSKLAV
jgi:hypothetical protein